MIEAFSDTTVVEAPADQVWAVLTDFQGAPAWMPGISSMRLDGDLGPGAVLRFRSRGKERSSVVSAVTPRRSITLTSTPGPVTAEYVYGVRPDGARTQVSLVARVAARGVLRPLGGVIRSSIARADGDQLDRLKAVIENG